MAYRTNRHPTSQQIAAYVDGELSRQEEKAFNRHLEACSHCRQAVLAQQQTISLLRRTNSLYDAHGKEENRMQRVLQRLHLESKTGQEIAENRFTPFQVVTGLVFTLLVFYGAQAFVSNLAAKAGADVGDAKVTGYVEDHVGFEEFYRTITE